MANRLGGYSWKQWRRGNPNTRFFTAGLQDEQDGLVRISDAE